MRISDLFGQRLWTTGLILAIAIGSYGVAEGQVQSSLGDTPQAQPNSTQSKIETWLAQTRQAINDGNAEKAKGFLQVAEAIANQPGEQLPAGFSFDSIKADIAQITATSVQPSAPAVFNLADSQGDNETAARTALLQARQALAQGDVASAQSYSDQAKEYQADFVRMGDSPQNIEAMIAKQNDLVEMQKGNDVAGFNNAAGLFFVEQANALMAYNDWKTAESLLTLAKSFPADYASNNINVDALLAQVQAEATPVAQPAMQVAQPQAPTAKESAMKLLSEAQLALDQERWEEANELVRQAKAYNVPDSEFAPGQMRPWQMELVVQDKISKMSPQAEAIADVAPVSATTQEDDDRHVIQADYIPEDDDSRIVQVAGTDENDRFAQRNDFNPIPSRGMQLYRSGLQSMDDGNTANARDRFESALQYREQLDQATVDTIRGHLASMTTGGVPATLPSQAEPMADDQQEMFRRLQSEVFKERSNAERLLQSSPRKALEKMTFVRNRISDSELDGVRKKPLITIIDRDINEMQAYIDQNMSEIINEEQNQRNMEAVELRQQTRLDTEQQIQRLTEDFNKLMDQGRWPEAEAIAQQAYDLDPDSEIVALLVETAKLKARKNLADELRAIKERETYAVIGPNIDEASTPMDARMPYRHGAGQDWIDKSRQRMQWMEEGQYDSAEDRVIWNTLKNTKVQGDYTGTLKDAVDMLSQQSGINIVFDNIAMQTTGVTTNSPVDMNIQNAITLQSALNIVLGDQGLVFVVEDEVIKVTSRDAQRSDLKVKTFYVGDLVTPLRSTQNPLQMNFISPNQNFNTQNSVLAGNGQMPFTAPQQMQANAGRMNTVAMGQQLPNSPFGGSGQFSGGFNDGPNSGTPLYTSTGAPQLGGVTAADFTNLIDLIKSTIAPDDWDDTNGDGSIQAFVPNLSLIVSNTQQVQDQIQDLLEKLRELNDVQIVVEVRFIILTDNFFERIGIDFDFRLNDNSGLNPNALPDEVQNSVAIGREPVPENFTPTGDLDIAFGQNSFASAIPQFGGFDAQSAANFGFAILSDIEVFFLIQASKGDSRSNITQAPTVTMFNGQSASVNDGSQRPFVTSVVPVVGDFAVAHQPVISLLPDGTSLNVQATVSADRRFVRLSLVPFFSQVTEVQTFTFAGSTTTRRASDSLLEDLLGEAGIGNAEDLEDLETIEEGTTVQLPVISFTTINTVVSVPDGGTVLMGGIKRMSEGRTERGVPFLSNVPYVNRLFKNVGIGRTTSNLMMMVTPRIIIQAEEEDIQVGPIGGN